MKRPMITLVLIAPIVLAGHTLYQAAYSQNARIIVVAAPADSAISVARFDAVNPAAFNDLFQDRSWEPLREFTLVLTNNTSRDIVGLAVEWKPDYGQLKVVRSDSFGDSIKQPVIPAKAQAILTPAGFHYSDVKNLASVVRPQSYESQPWDRTARITISVDAVIFDDGLVLGPDKSSLQGSIAGRKLAISHISETVRNAAAERRDVATALRELLPKRQGPPTSVSEADGVTLWTDRLVRELLRSPDRSSERLRQLEALPDYPVFFRRQ